MVSLGSVKVSKTLLLFAVVFALALTLSITRATTQYTWAWDEHTHLSYVQYMWQGVIPANGYPMNSWAKAAFSCHPHAIFGRMTLVPCGVIADGSAYPTGGTNTSQAWPPTYYLLTSVLMRPFQLFSSDPLFAARYATAVLWSVGVAFLSVIVWKRNPRVEQALTIGILLVALPIFGYFSSFVSPHSMNPLIAAGLLAAGFKWIDSFKLSSSVQRYVWPAIFIASAALAAGTIPQSILLVALVSVFVTVSIVFEPAIATKKRLLSVLGVLAAQIAACGVSLLVYWLWLYTINVRAIPYLASVDPSKANVDSSLPAHVNVLKRILDRLFSFWPNGLDPGLPRNFGVTAITLSWVTALTILSIAALILWRRSGSTSKLMAALWITAPIVSVGFAFYFTTEVPVRYGLGAAIIGTLALSNPFIHRNISRILLALAIITYIAAFLVSPVLVAAGVCQVGPDHLIDCVK